MKVFFNVGILKGWSFKAYILNISQQTEGYMLAIMLNGAMLWPFNGSQGFDLSITFCVKNSKNPKHCKASHC